MEEAFLGFLNGFLIDFEVWWNEDLGEKRLWFFVFFHLRRVKSCYYNLKSQLRIQVLIRVKIQ